VFSRPPFLADLQAVLGGKPRVLAWATTTGGESVAALLGHFAFSEPNAGWRCVRWEAIDHGSWADGKLVVSTCDGDAWEFEFSDPGDLPPVFEERVNASITFARRLQIGSGFATIAKRRNPADPNDPGAWRVTTTPGLSPDHPTVLAESARLRAEFD
jgi:hypothetical protein